MAKKKTEVEKKITVLSEDEQPYKLPEGWLWDRLGNVYQINPKNNADNEIEAAFVPMSKIEAGFTSGFDYEITTWEKAKKGHTQFADGDVAFAKISPCFENRKSFIAKNLPNSIGAGTTELIILRNQNILSEYTYRFITSENFISDCKNTYSGTVGQQRIDSKFVKNYLIPIPPKETQQKIVDIIESLFTKLDIAKEKVQAVLGGSELRRSAILHKAFNGELTEKWREENNVSFDTWKERRLQDVCSMKITDGTHKTPTYCDKAEGIPFISSKDVVGEKICWNNVKYITKELHEELYRRLSPQKNDVLLAKNGTTGVAAIVEDDRVFDIYVTLAVLRPEKDIIIPNFLLKVVNSPICKQQFNANLTGIGVPNLHLRDIKIVTIPLPTIPEQQEIVRLLDKFLSAEDTVKTTCQNTLATINTMKQSILAKAFRGELQLN